MLKKQFGQDELAERLGGIEARRRDPTVSMGTFEGIIYFSERQGNVELTYLPVGRQLANAVSPDQAESHNGDNPDMLIFWDVEISRGRKDMLTFAFVNGTSPGRPTLTQVEYAVDKYGVIW